MSTTAPAQALSPTSHPQKDTSNHNNNITTINKARNDDDDNATSTLTHFGFRIATRKLPILKAGSIERMTEQLGIAPPEMIFGDNFVRVEHVSSGWAIEFNAFDALDCVDKTGQDMLKVAYSGEWQRHRYARFIALNRNSAKGMIY